MDYHDLWEKLHLLQREYRDLYERYSILYPKAVGKMLSGIQKRIKLKITQLYGV